MIYIATLLMALLMIATQQLKVKEQREPREYYCLVVKTRDCYKTVLGGTHWNLLPASIRNSDCYKTVLGGTLWNLLPARVRNRDCYKTVLGGTLWNLLQNCSRWNTLEPTTAHVWNRRML